MCNCCRGVVKRHAIVCMASFSQKTAAMQEMIWGMGWEGGTRVRQRRDAVRLARDRAYYSIFSTLIKFVEPRAKNG
jgi:hypothetical protein